jgi:hypothetical protein
MRNLVLTAALALITTCIFGQSRQEQTQILQKCLDLQELQQYYPVDADGNPNTLIIHYCHPFTLPTDLTVTHGGRNAEFRLMSVENDKNADAYFFFQKFEILESTCHVSLKYCYGNSGNPKEIQVLLDLKKTGDAWAITNYTVNNQD